MAEGEEIGEGSLSSLTSGSLVFGQNENALSPEDLAWVDSFLTNAPEVPASDLNPLRDALVEVVDNYPEMFVSSSTRAELSANEDDMGVHSPEIEDIQQRTDQDLFLPFHGEAETMNNSSATEEVTQVLALLNFREGSKNSLQYFLSEPQNGFQTDNETLDPLEEERERLENGSVSDEEAESSSFKVSKDDFLWTSVQDTNMPHENGGDPFVNPNVLEDQIELSLEDIFKVWDLEIPVDEIEEDEFEQQLKRALDKTAARRPLSQPVDDPAVPEENSSIDDIIAGISDLCLTETFT